MQPTEGAVRFTHLKQFAKSPAHYLASLEEDRDTAAMRLGRLVHTIVLGGPPSAVWEGERRGKAWQQFKEENQDREIVTLSEVESATRIANAVLANPVAAPFLVGKTEVPAEWRMLGRQCATKGIDVLGSDFIADLKTASCTEPQRFGRACKAMAYHAQLAFYRDAAASMGLRNIRAGYIIGVETKAPYAVTVLRLRPDVLEHGARLCRLWMEQLVACEEANEWPAYVQDVVDLEVEDGLSLMIDGEEVAA